MNTAFDLEVQAHCPNAEVVYDLFHVIAKYGREVIDRVRVDEANRVRQDRKARQVIKSSRWLLLDTKRLQAFWPQPGAVPDRQDIDCVSNFVSHNVRFVNYQLASSFNPARTACVRIGG